MISVLREKWHTFRTCRKNLLDKGLFSVYLNKKQFYFCTLQEGAFKMKFFDTGKMNQFGSGCVNGCVLGQTGKFAQSQNTPLFSYERPFVKLYLQKNRKILR